MKKIVLMASVLVLASALTAADENAEKKASASDEAKVEARPMAHVWPAWFAVSQWPRSTDVIGVRLTIPFSSSQENVTGFDIGFWGKSIYFEGGQFNILRNDVTDRMTGVQLGIYNSVGDGDCLGIQGGLWNEARSFRGVQVGAINVCGEGEGVQFGFINRAETLYGYQIGFVNIIRSAEVSFFPIVNIGF